MNIRDILTILFISIAALSVFSMIGPTSNFANFYASLEEIYLKALKVHQYDDTNITLAFTILYNSNYIGYKLKYVSYELYFIANSAPERLTDGGKWYSPPIPLNPYENFTYVEPKILNINKEETLTFIELSQKNQSIQWILESLIYIDTFRGIIQFELSYP